MVYIKKLVMNGFKSFARKTEIVFDKGVNVILGPNGSGKSNIADALCFVLGRLSIKSIRAEKAKNLLFMGSKYAKPSQEASVELVFDNSDRAFNIEKEEVHLSRTVRHNGLSAYKINGELKNRAEVIEMLAQANIDPYGFNLILQGQIQSIVKIHPEERRKIIEEVAGISIYESRKEKSLHELEKTDEKLKEISTILRERTAFLRNLEKERSQAMRYKELEITIKRCKFSILQKKIDDKQKEIDSLIKSIEEKAEQKNKIREKSETAQKSTAELGEEIQHINKSIQQAAGIEQETLHTNIADLKAELEGIKVRKESYENRREDIERRIEELKKSIPDIEEEIEQLRKESPLIAEKSEELKKKKEELSGLEEERGKLLAIRTEFSAIKEVIRDKERQISYTRIESESLLKQIENISIKMKYKNEEECAKEINSLRKKLNEKEQKSETFRSELLEHEKVIAVCKMEIGRLEKIKGEVEKLDICPLCQSKITPEHIDHVKRDCENNLHSFKADLDKSHQKLSHIKSEMNILDNEIESIKTAISSCEEESSGQMMLKEKNENLKKSVYREKSLKDELAKLEEKRRILEAKIGSLSNIQEKYDSKILDIEEISSRTAKDVDTSLLYKEREVENTRNVIKRSSADLKELIENIKEIEEKIAQKERVLQDSERKERELNLKFKKMFEHRDLLQRKLQEKTLQLSEMQNDMRQIDDQINYLKLGKARADAEKEAQMMEISDYKDVEIIQGSLSYLEERLSRSQEAIQQVGLINMRALEVYEEIKKEYSIVQSKVDILERERQEILNIITEIDQKKSKAFMKTFKVINYLFSVNFAKLHSKGTASLELENEEDIFSGGVNIAVRLAKRKYFDVTSLSGGEQTLVALSLLFAIQEYKPYHFYIFDEIDAALDKRNSERLAALLAQYIKSGQYIVITHNDAIIMKSNVLYGISMQEGVSKILSLKVDENMHHEKK